MFYLFLIANAVAMLLLMWMPVMRKTEAFFGVRVSEEYYAGEGRRVLRSYRLWLAMIFLTVEAIAGLITHYRGEVVLANVFTNFLLIFAGMLLYSLSYQQVKPAATQDHETKFAAPLTVRRLADHTNLFLELMLALALLLPVGLLVYYYPELPEKLPVHWNAKGEPDGWARKSFLTVFLLPVLGVYLSVVFLAVKHGVLQTKLTLPAEQAQEYLRLKEKGIAMMVRLMDRLRLIVTVLFATLELNLLATTLERYALWKPYLTVGLWGIVLSIPFLAILSILGMVNLDAELREKVGRVYVQRPADAECWYWGGLIYYNPNDPAVFVEKLVGIGMTVNMGNWRALLYLAIFLVPIPFFVLATMAFEPVK